MAVYASEEKRAEIFAEYGGNANNTGSVEGQVAWFTFRIKEMSDHLKNNHKDHACRRSLLRLVGKRKRLLVYLAKKDINGYRALIEKLGLRK